MAPVTRRSARGHAPGAPRLWKNHRIQDISALVKTRKLRRLEKPEKQTVGNPDEPTTAPPALPPPAADVEVETQAPVTSPEPQSPNEQLEFELSKHASIALQARATREKEEDKEILELLTLLDKKVSSMKQRSLTRASSFGNALQSFVHNYFTQPSMVARDKASTANPAPARPPPKHMQPLPPRPNQTAKLRGNPIPYPLSQKGLSAFSSGSQQIILPAIHGSQQDYCLGNTLSPERIL